jgi:hypothetical protein
VNYHVQLMWFALIANTCLLYNHQSVNVEFLMNKVALWREYFIFTTSHYSIDASYSFIIKYDCFLSLVVLMMGEVSLKSRPPSTRLYGLILRRHSFSYSSPWEHGISPISDNYLLVILIPGKGTVVTDTVLRRTVFHTEVWVPYEEYYFVSNIKQHARIVDAK